MTDEEIKQEQDPVSEVQDALGFDDAGKSLAKALRLSFVILKIVMVILVAFFLVSGIFEVKEDEQAIVLRFGEIQGIGKDRVLGPGLHFAWPEPIDEIVALPVKRVQPLAINSFWYYESPSDKLRAQARFGKTLNPAKDGYCLTANDSIAGAGTSDYNIVHAQWILDYTIDFPERFFRNVYYRAPKPGEDFIDVMAETVNPLLEAMVADAVVATMVNYTIEEAIKSKTYIARDVQRRVQQKLDSIGSGIRVVTMQAKKITWPRQVDADFQQSNKAKQESQKQITEAKSYAEKTLNEAGGFEAEEVLAALEDTTIIGDQRLLQFLRLAGTAQEMLADAKAYKTKVVETAKTNADYLQKLLPEYQKRPKLVLQEIYRSAIEEVLAGADEKIFIESSGGGKARELRVLINRDPSIKRTKTKEKDQGGL
ncbi:MAG TPA: protease modulator HflK [Phycisphaerales bacterium]|nr:protease modulator HflK [Phycisphaerales bacterium]